MHCPYCEEKIGLFSKAINRFTKKKNCPHCGKPIKLGFNWYLFAALFLPALALALFSRTYFEAVGLSGALSTGLSVGLLIVLTMRINRDDVA